LPKRAHKKEEMGMKRDGIMHIKSTNSSKGVFGRGIDPAE